MSPPVSRRATAPIPTRHGRFLAVGYESDDGANQHIALVRGDVEGSSGVLVRIHSECLTGDVFGSLRCDCGPQLDAAMERVATEGVGIIVYMRGHEGRGIGLMRKLEAYALQDEGLDTVEANEQLGYAADSREYDTASWILSDLGVESVRLLTNNPAKRLGLEHNGTVVDALVPLTIDPTADNRVYLATKALKLGHLLDPDTHQA